MDNIMSKLRSLDAYPKINEDFYSRTLSGGLITLVSSIVMLLLFFSELRKIHLFLSLSFYVLVQFSILLGFFVLTINCSMWIWIWSV